MLLDVIVLVAGKSGSYGVMIVSLEEMEDMIGLWLMYTMSWYGRIYVAVIIADNVLETSILSIHCVPLRYVGVCFTELLSPMMSIRLCLEVSCVYHC